MRKWVRNLLIAVVVLMAVFGLLIVVAIARPLLHRGSNDLGIHQTVDAPGAVISAREVFDIPLRLKLAKVHAVHVLYASRDASGVIQRVSGTVFKPDGAALAGVGRSSRSATGRAESISRARRRAARVWMVLRRLRWA